MKAPLGDQPTRQQEDDLVSMSSDYAVQFSDIDSDARGHGQSKRIFIQPPVTINLFGAGAGPAAATTFSNTGISGSSDPIISRLESQIAALSSKVEQLASQVNSVQPRLQVDGGEWSTQNIQCSYPRGPTQHRITFEKRFKSAPRVVREL
ncbi:hypothetical protein TrVFT333_008710 [Trichoderma virens FT-333]|nr:hypothetical protein TrVFT333_008710 [Trichoderma virens FT-333]